MDAIDMKTFGLMAAIGKIELDNFRERSTLGKRGTAKQGRVPMGGLPYGYRIGDDGRPEVVEEQAEIVRRIFHMYVHEGMGSPSIAVQLTDEGIPTQTGKLLWRQSYIHYVLANATYTGTWVYGKTRVISTDYGTKEYDQPRDTWIEVPVPPLVDEKTWETAQAERDLRSIQMEEDRAIRLFVSGKITETQLDHQRRFITERLESARAKLDDYRAQEASGAEKRRLMEAVLAWAREVGQGLDELTPEQRKEILQMIVEQIVIDRDNNVDITLAIPIDEDSPESDSVAIASESSWSGSFPGSPESGNTPSPSSPCFAGEASASSPSPSRQTTPPPASSLRPSSRAWTNSTRKILPRRSRGECGRPLPGASG